MSMSAAKLHATTRFRLSDVDALLPPPLPLIDPPDEVRLAHTGVPGVRPTHLPVRRHIIESSGDSPTTVKLNPDGMTPQVQMVRDPEPILRESRVLVESEAEEDEAREIVARLHVYEYNQPEVQQNCGASEDTLVFDSLFESGNLQRAERIYRRHESSKQSAKRHEYELMIRPDIKNSAYRQWFYFEVRNGKPGIVHKFSLANLAKSGARFGNGLQPVVYSEIDAETKGVGWVHRGTHVRYDVSLSPDSAPGTTCLSFQYEFEHEHDRVYFACLQPYTYTDLAEYLEKLERDPERAAVCRRTELCQSIAQNTCDLLSITSYGKDGLPPDEKRDDRRVLSARAPGRAQQQLDDEGMIDYLTGTSSVAQILRKHFLFKVAPMLNPDGVINGNTRVSLAGWELNRKWSWPVEKLFPTVFRLKRLIANLQVRDRVAIYCDLHDHSLNRNIFTYGCYNKKSGKKASASMLMSMGTSTPNLGVGGSSNGSGGPSSRASVKNDPRVFPMIVAKNSHFFSFASCDFKVHKSKLNTARVVVNHELGVINSYTLEASFCGPDFGPRKDTQFSTWDLEEMGKSWCQSLLIYFDLVAEDEPIPPNHANGLFDGYTSAPEDDESLQSPEKAGGSSWRRKSRNGRKKPVAKKNSSSGNSGSKRSKSKAKKKDKSKAKNQEQPADQPTAIAAVAGDLPEPSVKKKSSSSSRSKQRRKTKSSGKKGRCSSFHNAKPKPFASDSDEGEEEGDEEGEEKGVEEDTCAYQLAGVPARVTPSDVVVLPSMPGSADRKRLKTAPVPGNTQEQLHGNEVEDQFKADDRRFLSPTPPAQRGKPRLVRTGSPLVTELPLVKPLPVLQSGGGARRGSLKEQIMEAYGLAGRTGGDLGGAGTSGGRHSERSDDNDGEGDEDGDDSDASSAQSGPESYLSEF